MNVRPASCLLLSLFLPTLAPAALTSLAVTGWNHDIVWGAGELGGSISGSMDNGGGFLGSTWYGVGRNVDAPATGLPIGPTTSQTVPDLSFTLQPFAGASNALLLSTNQTGTLVITTPLAMSRVALIGSTGNGTGDNTVTVNHANGSSQVFSTLGAGINSDWFGGAEIAYTANGRTSNGTSFDNVNNNQPRLYQEILTLTNTTSPVTSITFSKAGTGHTAIMAVSGEAIPEPAAAGFLGLAALTALRRRKRPA